MQRATSTRAVTHGMLRLSVAVVAAASPRRASFNRREEDKMEGLWSPDMWGTPVGLGIFFLGMGIGMGVFFWGVSKLPTKKK